MKRKILIAITWILMIMITVGYLIVRRKKDKYKTEIK